MDCFDRDTLLKVLVFGYEEIRAAADAVEEGLNASAPDAVCVQNSLSAQTPRIDVSKVWSPESVPSLVRKKKGTWRRCGAGTSKDWNSDVADVVI